MDLGWEWKEEDKAWIPVMTTLPLASGAIIHLVQCRCAKESGTTKRGQCRKAEMNCTDLCGCFYTGEDMPEDVGGDNDDQDDRNDDDDDDDEAEYEYISASDDNLDSESELMGLLVNLHSAPMKNTHGNALSPVPAVARNLQPLYHVETRVLIISCIKCEHSHQIIMVLFFCPRNNGRISFSCHSDHVTVKH